MVEYLLGKSKRSPDRCMYPSKPCHKKRAYKLNGQLHKLCEEHRQQANLNQKRLQQRRKMKQLQELQVYVLDTFAQGPEPDDEAYNAFAYGGKVEPHTFIARNNPSAVYDPHLHFFPDDDTTTNSDSSMFDWDSLVPLRLDEDESNFSQSSASILPSNFDFQPVHLALITFRFAQVTRSQAHEMTSIMQTQWRTEVSEDMRKQLVTAMYHELVRIAGHDEPQKVWGSAAKFELTLWTNSADCTTYLTKMQRKIVRLRQKQPLEQPQVHPGVLVAPQQPQLPQNMMQTDKVVTVSSNGPGTTATSVTVPTPAPVPTSATVVRGVADQTAVAREPTSAQLQTQQWLQRLQLQFQAQVQQLLHMQQLETQQLHRQQLAQTQQLMQQHQQQRVPEELKRQQLQQLRQQHELARVSLQQLQASKQQQIRLKQQQYLLQKQQQLQINLQMSQPMSSQPAQMDAAVTRGITPEQLQAAHDHQARMRDMQRAKNTAEQERKELVHATPGVTTPQQLQLQMHQARQAQAQANALAQAQAQDQASSPLAKLDQKPGVKQANGAVAADASYWERHGVLKTKYWNDVVVVYQEFERLVKQKPPSQQLERIKPLLNTLRQIVAFFLQDPAKAKNCDKNDLDRVALCIQKQVLPLLHRLREKKRLSENQPNNGAITGSAAATEAVASPNQAAKATLATQRAQQEALKKTQQEKMKKLQEAMLQQHEEKKKKLEAQKVELQRTLQEEQKKKIQEEADTAEVKKQQEAVEQACKQKQLRETQQAQQQQQQDRARWLHQEQMLATAARHKELITQQQAALKVMQQQEQEEVATDKTMLKEEAPASLTLGATALEPPLALPAATATVAKVASPGTPKTEVSSVAVVALTDPPAVVSPEAKKEEDSESVVPDLAGLSPSEKLVTAVSALEKNNSDVLRRSSERFSRIAIAVGAKLCTAYEVSA